MILSKPQWVVEHDHPFLSLWPHRYDYIWAPHPAPDEKPKWQTESRHPLSDRLIQQGAYLYGVRFDSQTSYCLLDIDADSTYHPQHDPLAISRLVAALEPLGLVSYVVCTSSYSQGLHLYFPFEIAQNSWQLSKAVTTLLENQGFKCQPGQLEVFPNSKLYVVEGTPNLFNAHRLPLQAGSYLLNDQLEPINSSQPAFVQQWQWCRRRNSVDTAVLEQILQQCRRQRHRVSHRADKFLNDLNAEIELGWTGKGQTNHLLGRITMRAYVFHHVIHGGMPLSGDTLVAEIVATATSLPGYREWCGHQYEIHQRAAEWARCVENSHYFPYGTQQGKYKAKKDLENNTVVEKTWNQQRAQTAQEKIKSVVADLLRCGQFPETATARFQKLISYGIGGGTLYKYKALWHPDLWKAPQTPQSSIREEASATASPATASRPTSLLPVDGRNALCDNALSCAENVADQGGVRNEGPPPMWRGLLGALKERQAQQKSASRSQKETRSHSKARQSIQNQAKQMAEYLRSQDPILIGEGLKWSLCQADIPLNHLLPENFMDWSHLYPQLTPLVIQCQSLMRVQDQGPCLNQLSETALAHGSQMGESSMA
ncbi:hypothetical protein C7271_00075 [filamentous cyanobacterium CCP5]|nr:hypothetical protein C7271_00075 [filamentous cyanobacterium CCP5]